MAGADSSSIFNYKDYKPFLEKSLDVMAQIQKGQKLKLAAFLNCKPSYISQVLNGHLDLSPEQALAVVDFLGLTEKEGTYFFNMVLHERAGTVSLKKHYQDELKKILADHKLLKSRITVSRTLNKDEQARYYSAWYFAAIHMIVLIPKFRTRERIAVALDLPLKLTNKALEFLNSIGVIKLERNEFVPGDKDLFLGLDSPFLSKHQTNWRMYAIRALDQLEEHDLHYSGVITCSAKDVEAIREIMLKTLQNIRQTVKNSGDETLYVYNLDLFGLLLA